MMIYLGILLQMRDQISNEHIRDEVLTLILSGHETTANVMSWAFSYLAKNPKVRKQLEDEADNATWIKEGRTPTYLELEESSKVASAILQETMRLAPPVWVAPRIATTDCIIDGVKIPKGAHVLVSQYVTHRNPRFFPDQKNGNQIVGWIQTLRNHFLAGPTSHLVVAVANVWVSTLRSLKHV
jgi:Cytochrome P450